MRKRFKTGNPPNEAKAIAERAEDGRAGSLTEMVTAPAGF